MDMKDALRKLEQQLDAVEDADELLPSVRLEAALRRYSRELEQYVRAVETLRYLQHKVSELQKALIEFETRLAEHLHPLVTQVAALEGLKEVRVPMAGGYVFVKPSREAASVEVEPDAPLEELKERGLAREKIVIVPDKRAIRAAIERGEEVPGCRLVRQRRIHIGFRLGDITEKAELPEPPETAPEVDDITDLLEGI